MLMLYNLVGFMASFQIIRTEWRSYVHETLLKFVSPDEITTFHFAKNEFSPSENEFQKNGQYYDVVRYETVGDSVEVVCFSDENETRLVTEFQTVLMQKMGQKTDFQGKIQLVFQLMIKEFLFEKGFSLKYPPPVFEAFLTDFYHKNPLFTHPFLDFDSPPPK
jgi:hypothetical protein